MRASTLHLSSKGKFELPQTELMTLCLIRVRRAAAGGFCAEVAIGDATATPAAAMDVRNSLRCIPALYSLSTSAQEMNKPPTSRPGKQQPQYLFPSDAKFDS